MNDCDKNAECRDTEDGYICQCKPGFYDDGNDPRKPGRICVGLRFYFLVLYEYIQISLPIHNSSLIFSLW